MKKQLIIIMLCCICSIQAFAQKKKKKKYDLVGVLEPLDKNWGHPNYPKNICKALPVLPKMLLIPAGTFQMGNENTPKKNAPHQVTVSGFYMAETEITNQQFCEFLNANKDSTDKLKTWIDWQAKDAKIEKKGNQFLVKNGFEKHPVTYVSWGGAQAFCTWLTKIANDWRAKEGRILLPNYRLPTEAEWEYIAKVGHNEKHNIDKVAWHKENTSAQIQPVKKRKKNKFGVYDLQGNAEEWCLDVFRNIPDDEVLDFNPYVGKPVYKQKDGTVTLKQPLAYNRVTKGGSAFDAKELVVTYERQSRAQQAFFKQVGFRVVMIILAKQNFDAY